MSFCEKNAAKRPHTVLKLVQIAKYWVVCISDNSMFVIL